MECIELHISLRCQSRDVQFRQRLRDTKGATYGIPRVRTTTGRPSVVDVSLNLCICVFCGKQWVLLSAAHPALALLSDKKAYSQLDHLSADMASWECARSVGQQNRSSIRETTGCRPPKLPAANPLARASPMGSELMICLTTRH